MRTLFGQQGKNTRQNIRKTDKLAKTEKLKKLGIQKKIEISFLSGRQIDFQDFARIFLDFSISSNLSRLSADCRAWRVV